MQIPDRTFLVTGGGSGLGEATARKLAASGARIVIADVAEDNGRRVAAEIGDSARFVNTDVTSEDAVRPPGECWTTWAEGLCGWKTCGQSYWTKPTRCWTSASCRVLSGFWPTYLRTDRPPSSPPPCPPLFIRL